MSDWLNGDHVCGECVYIKNGRCTHSKHSCEGPFGFAMNCSDFKLKGEKMSGRKDDQDKNRLDLIPPYATEGVGRILTFGAKKYESYNWAKGIAYSRIIGAIKRHLTAIERGEDRDPESEELHIDHIACNAAFLQTFQRFPDRYGKFDDRFWKPIDRTEPIEEGY